MKELTYNERIAMMRILWDIIFADKKLTVENSYYLGILQNHWN